MTGLCATQRWFPSLRSRREALVRLFCFPYAGGGASVYRGWASDLPDFVEVCPVQLPGREGRFREPAFTRLGPLVEALTESLRPCLDRPFAFFGHSLGALVAFELSRRLRREGRRPVRLGRSSAHHFGTNARSCGRRLTSAGGKLSADVRAESDLASTYHGSIE